MFNVDNLTNLTIRSGLRLERQIPRAGPPFHSEEVHGNASWEVIEVQVLFGISSLIGAMTPCLEDGKESMGEGWAFRIV